MVQGAPIWCCDSLEGWDGVRGEREIQQRGDISIPMADSYSCTAESKTIL